MKRSTIMLAGAALLIGLATTQAGAASFSVLDYNVRGLPPPFIEDRTTQMAQIAPKLEDFHTPAATYVGQQAIVLLQELFHQNYYNTLMNPATVTYPFKTAKDTGGPNGIGDGLNRLSDFEFFDHFRTQWTACFGSGGANGSDCDTNKGFSYARHEIEQGIFVEVYDLHADAGQDTGSRTARRSNITQLVAAINANSPLGDAVIVMGDTNSLYTRVDPAKDNIDTLLSGTGVADVWVELVKGGVVPSPGPDNESECLTNPSGPNCELVDKIFYRSGSDLTLIPKNYAALKTFFSDGSGNDLSDHYPVTVVFDYTIVTTSTSSTSSTSSSTTTTTTLPPRPCGDPVALIYRDSAGDTLAASVTASDALRILKAAVGQPVTCEPCVCDANNSGSITTSDALLVLKFSVGQPVTLNCPAC
ncbi:MAG: endonuclease/exonuclease/phosphatase family protein [Deltaproteobacteria bacterium]|nr:endonuclease/exonuclease/phosphatase family protein [Deltaproteobacteria bacterium]